LDTTLDGAILPYTLMKLVKDPKDTRLTALIMMVITAKRTVTGFRNLLRPETVGKTTISLTTGLPDVLQSGEKSLV